MFVFRVLAGLNRKLTVIIRSGYWIWLTRFVVAETLRVAFVLA
jgi:hypothetical protein